MFTPGLVVFVDPRFVITTYVFFLVNKQTCNDGVIWARSSDSTTHAEAIYGTISTDVPEN